MRELLKSVVAAAVWGLIVLFVWNVIIVPMFLTSPISVTCAIIWGIVIVLVDYALIGATSINPFNRD